MNGMQIGLFSAGIGINFLLATIFAIAVRHGSGHGHTDGYTALLVIIGVSFTLIVNQTFLYAPSNQLLDGVLTLAGFAASGTPMTIEYFMRRAEQRRIEEESERDSRQTPK